MGAATTIARLHRSMPRTDVWRRAVLRPWMRGVSIVRIQSGDTTHCSHASHLGTIATMGICPLRRPTKRTQVCQNSSALVRWLWRSLRNEPQLCQYGSRREARETSRRRRNEPSRAERIGWPGRNDSAEGCNGMGGRGPGACPENRNFSGCRDSTPSHGADGRSDPGGAITARPVPRRSAGRFLWPRPRSDRRRPCQTAGTRSRTGPARCAWIASAPCNS
jgi:hypothetical protein